MHKDEDSWTLEQEGMIAVLLRRFAKCEDMQNPGIILDELRNATGKDFGNRLNQWLAWYLEDHMGMRNAVGILSGKLNIPNDSEPVKSLMSEDVFDRAEYNWCALERVKNKDDMQKLRCLYSDLESIIQTDAEGPLAFARLSGADTDDLEFFRGKSISSSLFSEDIQIRHLRILKDYGKMMMMPLFPSSTQRAGAIVYASAISQALVKFETKITSLSYKDLADSLPGLADRPYVVDSYIILFKQATEKCG